MTDILYNAAKSFKNLLKYDYHFVLGDSKRQKTFSIISNEKEMFTHICGIDHLRDIAAVTAKRLDEKAAIFKNILRKKIKYSDIVHSKYLHTNMSNRNNPHTNSPYTIEDRIIHLSNIENILDNSFKGKIYKWTGGKTSNRNCKIQADYLLTIPSDVSHKEKYYFFLVKVNNNNDKSIPIKTKIISAFADSEDLTVNLANPYTILELSKIEIKTNTTIFTQTYPSYQKEKDEADKKLITV